MSKAPYFPFYVRNWLCSRTVARMSGDEVRAYVYLLAEAWLQTPRATLPNDRIELASMARMSPEQWDCISDSVLRAFKIGQCDEHKGRFYNETQLEISRKWENNQRHNNKNAKRTRVKREANATLKEIVIDIPLNLSSSSLFLSSWNDWKQHRKELKKKMTNRSEVTLLKKLCEMGPVRAVAAINHSIANGWTGIFEPKAIQREYSGPEKGSPAPLRVTSPPVWKAPVIPDDEQVDQKTIKETLDLFSTAIGKKME